MEFAFPWPYSIGEWLAWTGAALTALFGILHLIAPGLAATAARTHGDSRSLGGFYAGIGLSAILFAQPLVYLALGIAWTFAVLGQLLTMVFDKGGRAAKLPGLMACILMAVLPLLFALGFVT